MADDTTDTGTSVASDTSGNAGTAAAPAADAGTPATTTDAGTLPADAGTGDAGSGGADDGGTAAPVDYTVMVAIPSGMNSGLTSVAPAAMTTALGNPGTPDPACGASSPALQALMKTANVGPFRCTGLGPAIDALTRVFSAVQSSKPDLYALLGTQGMLCVRYMRGSTTNFSNHSWGTAIDITIGGVLVPRGSSTVSQGLVDLATFMAAEQFFWGAGFSPTPDGMHYEVSAELIAAWKANGTIP